MKTLKWYALFLCIPFLFFTQKTSAQCSVDAGPDVVIDCINPTAFIAASAFNFTAPVQYTWTGPCLQSSTSSAFIEVYCAGVYTVTIVDADGCTATDDVNVLEDYNFPLCSIIGSGTIDCNNSTVDLIAECDNPDYTYEWLDPTGVVISNVQATSVFSPGIYTLTATGFNGCTSQTTYEVTVDFGSATANAGAGGELNCINTSFILDGTGSSIGAEYSYEWTGNAGQIINGATTLTPVVTSPGAYTLIVTNTNSGCTSTDVVFVTEDSGVPLANAGAGGELNCINTSFILDGTGSSIGAEYSYEWTGNAGQIINGATTLTPEVTSPGTYTLIVTNTNSGCTSQSSVLITEDTNIPIVDIGEPGFLNCLNTTVILDGSNSSSGPEYVYQWSSSSGSIISGANTLTPVVDAPGVYTLNVTNTNNGCFAQAFVDVVADYNTPFADAGTDLIYDCNTNLLTLDGGGSDIGPDIVYEWLAYDGGNILSGGDTQYPIVDAPGTYYILVTNLANGCISEAVTFVTDVLDFSITGSTVISGNVVKIDWTAVTDPDFEKFRLRYRPVGGSWTEVNALINYRFLNNLMPSTQYEYQVKAKCLSGRSTAWSTSQYFTTEGNICDFPTSSSASFSGNTATVSWSADPDDLKYKIKYKETGAAWTELTLNPNSYSISPINAGATYKYKLKTKCNSGWTNWSEKRTFSVPVLRGQQTMVSTNELTIFPNPIQDQANLSFELEKEDEVQIAVIDATGKQVQLLCNQRFEVGEHRLVFDVNKLERGVYFIQLSTISKQETKRIAVME